jgi:tRNA pseudouridine38-40 synthase
MAINAHLRMNNDHIRVINSEIVDDSFHARFSAQKRYYQYIILNAENESPFWLNRALHIYGKLDLEKMQQAARCLIGKHDFTSLRATHCQAKSPIITLDNIEIVQQEQLFFINIKARSFLHHMVRNITGLLINVGQDKLQINEVKRIIDAKDRKVAPATVKPWGLYFMKVDY